MKDTSKKALRRGHNEGNIRQRTDGRWEVRLSVGIDYKTGKPKRTSTCCNTRQEANEYAASRPMPCNPLHHRADLPGSPQAEGVAQAEPDQQPGVLQQDRLPKGQGKIPEPEYLGAGAGP